MDKKNQKIPQRWNKGKPLMRPVVDRRQKPLKILETYLLKKKDNKKSELKLSVT